MKTPAIIASLTVAGSVAFAAGQQSGGKQSPPMPSRAQAHSMQEEMPQARMAQARMAQMGGGCTQGADKNWFTTMHPLPADCKAGSHSWTWNGMDYTIDGDINGDGTAEHFVIFLEQSVVVSETSAQSGGVLALNNIGSAAEDYAVSNHRVVHNETVAAFVLEQYPTVTQAFVANLGLRDVDGDGDMDLVITIGILIPPSDQFMFRMAWVENTGYEKPAPPLAADLNQDGQVDGADLGLLLVAWGPNP
jgi:hypothetical protein